MDRWRHDLNTDVRTADAREELSESEQSDFSLSCHSSSFDELDPDNNDSRVNHYQFEPYASDAQLSDENVHEIVDDNNLNMAHALRITHGEKFWQ